MTAIKSPDIHKARITIEAVCHDCKHRHTIDVLPDHFGRAAFDWHYKHQGHEVEFLSPERFIPRGFDDRVYEREGQAPWWLDYRHNADIKIAYAADAAFTITLASLGTSTTWLSGRQSTSVSNGTNKYLDYEITGKITTGTTITADTEIRLYAIKPINDTPTWPDAFGSTDAAASVTNAQILAKLPLIWAGTVSNTNNVSYPVVSAMTLAQAWGFVPDNFILYVAHNTGNNLNATGSNHELSHRGIYLTSV